MKRYGKIAITSLVALLLCAAVWIAAVMVMPVLAAPTTAATIPTAHPDIKTAALVYIMIYSSDASQVYDTTANGAAGDFVAIASVTYANAAITVPVNTDFYIGQIKIPTNIRRNTVFVRGYASSDATADKNDTQIFAWMCQFDSNGWCKWSGSDVYSF